MTNHQQTVRIGPHITSTLSTGSSQRCLLSLLLYTIYTCDCIPNHSTNTIIKSMYDSTVLGLILVGDEMDYRDKIKRLVAWRITLKTKELMVDFQRNARDFITSKFCVERVNKIKFLGRCIKEGLSWTRNTITLVKKSQQQLQILRKNNLQRKLLMTFYHCSIESVWIYCITIWYASCLALVRKAFQRIIDRAQKITGYLLLSQTVCKRHLGQIFS